MNALVTYIYPNAITYIYPFLEKLANQTNQNFKLIIFNDLVKNLKLPETDFEIVVYELAGTPIEIRINSFEILKVLNFENYIFIDIDDSMSDNRIEILENKLAYHSIVCNDLNLINENGEYIQKMVWKNRIKNNFTFNYDFIQDKNIIGFGNVALKKNILSEKLAYSTFPVVGDWFIFYQLLKRKKISCLFTSECQTNYRQHSNNQIGLQEMTEEKWTKALEVAKFHYKGLIEIGIENKIPNFNNQFLKKELNNQFPFWWEEIQIIDEKN